MKKLRFVSTIVFLIATLSSTQSFGNQGPNVFFGIVGPGSGNGVAGHGFLLVQKPGTPLATSDFYQYNLRLPDGSPLPAGELNVNFSDLIFKLDKMIFGDVLMKYTEQDDRTVVLYKLGLGDSTANSLISRLDDEFASTRNADQYSLFSNNCITRLLEVLNETLDGQDQISLFTPDRTFLSPTEVGFIAARSAFLNRAPFYLSRTLEEHPLVTDREVFIRKTNQTVKHHTKLRETLFEIKNHCLMGEEIYETLVTAIDLAIKSQNFSYVQSSQEFIFGSCGKSDTELVAEPWYRASILIFQLAKGTTIENEAFNLMMELYMELRQ